MKIRAPFSSMAAVSTLALTAVMATAVLFAVPFSADAQTVPARGSAAPVSAPAKSAAATVDAVGSRQQAPRDPIDIKSDRLEAHNKERKIIFIGNVQARQRDTLIFADRLVAFYEKDGKDVERIVAQGNVKITQDEKIATSREAVFENRSRKIVLTGEPHLWQGKDELRGEMITVFMDEDRVLVERASGTFSPSRLQEAEVSH